MSSNSFGNIFKITTWGESHGKAIGVVIDGCPAGLNITDEEINYLLSLRAPGRSSYTSPRKETDRAQILSGVFRGKTTGAPISIIVYNEDHDSSKYEGIKNILRPGHANYTYLEKYGIFDYRGGGRSSARNTVSIVAAGAVAKKFLAHNNINIVAYLKQVNDVIVKNKIKDLKTLSEETKKSAVFCPEEKSSLEIMALIEAIKEEKDSLGGIVEFIAEGVPVGLGDPFFEKIEANLAKAMLSIPASKGFEIGDGFDCVHTRGSENNDIFVVENDKIKTNTNHAGGVLGGISSGMPITGRVVFKPTPSIEKKQKSIDTEKNNVELSLPKGSRHDPCVAIRAVPIVESMAALVLADCLLLKRSSKL
jgi:chorismate synthase